MGRKQIPDTQRGTGVSPVGGDQRLINDDQPVIDRRHGAYLPHWTKASGGIYAVTFRLADSLPSVVLERLIRERDELRQEALHNPEGLIEEAERRLTHLFSARIEEYLDAGSGACWMKDGRIARMIAQSLIHFHQQRYALHAWCVMPNHVHVLVEPQQGWALPAILHGWKSFTAKQANRILGRTGTFWQPEYYDHLIRDESEYSHSVHYIEQNPTVAGMISWPWVSSRTGVSARL